MCNCVSTYATLINRPQSYKILCFTTLFCNRNTLQNSKPRRMVGLTCVPALRYQSPRVIPPSGR